MTTKLETATQKSIREAVLDYLNVTKSRQLKKFLVYKSSVTNKQIASNLKISVENAQNLRKLGLSMTIGDKTFMERDTWVLLFTYLELDPNHEVLEPAKQVAQKKGIRHYLREVIEAAVKDEYKARLLAVVDSDLKPNTITFWTQFHNAVFNPEILDLGVEVEAIEVALEELSVPKLRERLAQMTDRSNANEQKEVMASYVADDENKEANLQGIYALKFNKKADLLAAIQWLEAVQAQPVAVS